MSSNLRQGQVLYVLDDREWRIIMLDKNSKSLVIRQMFGGHLHVFISEFWKGNPMTNEEYRKLIPIIFRAKRIEDARGEDDTL